MVLVHSLSQVKNPQFHFSTAKTFINICDVMNLNRQPEDFE
jgi:hypothetical protein